MNVLTNIGTSIKNGWQNLSRQKKIGLVTVVASILLLVSGLAYLVQKVDYALLFSDLEEADAGNIVNDLEAKQIPYRLEDNGATIYIDAQQVDTYRIELAVNDMLPDSATGFEIFDETSMMATDEDREIMYQRAVTGELERAIGALDGVESVSVILSIPEKSIFETSADQAEASASVMLQLEYGNSLDDAAVMGIASLVSGAVENLPTENIKIVDGNGTLLSGILSEDTYSSADVASRYQSITQNYESQLEQKLYEVLSPIYGANNLSIAVNAQLNFDAVEEEMTVYGDAAIRSQSESAAGGEIEMGEDGVTENDQTISQIVTGEDGGTSSYDSTVNNELDTTTTRTVQAPGTVEDLTASIMFNNAVNGPDADDIQEIVANTLGTAQDKISIVGVDFADSEETAEVTAEEPVETVKTFLQQYGLYLAGGAALLILLAVAFAVMRKRRYTEEEEDELELEEAVPALSLMQEREKAEARNKAERALQEMINDEKLGKDKEIRDYAKANPELAADLIKIWLKEE